MTEVLFKCECKEPKGRFIREVKSVEFTPEFLKKLWAKQYPKFKHLMGKEMVSFSQFVAYFVRETPNNKLESRGLCLEVDDVGIFWISDINYPGYAEVHYTFWDGRLRGRDELCKKAIKYVFDVYGFNRLYVNVALWAGPHKIFVESLGFKHEGRMRSCARFKDVWWDVNMYSLLKDEVSGWTFPEIE